MYKYDVYVCYDGVDSFGRKTYIDVSNGEIIKDIGDGKYHTCTKAGEPDMPLFDTRVIIQDDELNQVMVDKIIKIIIDNKLGYDTSIYYNNKRIDLNDNNIGAISNDKGSRVTKYSNDATITLTFEGPLYRALNGYGWNLDEEQEDKLSVYEQIDKVADEYGYYFQFGEAWNMTLYKI